MFRKETRRYFQNRLRYLGSFHLRALLTKTSVRQQLRMLAAAVEWKLHRIHCASRPFAFRIEAAAICNLRCPLCSTTHRTFGTDSVRLMSLKAFAAIFEKIQPCVTRITFYMEGEVEV